MSEQPASHHSSPGNPLPHQPSSPFEGEYEGSQLSLFPNDLQESASASASSVTASAADAHTQQGQGQGQASIMDAVIVHDSEVVDWSPEHRRVILPANITRAQAVATLNKRCACNEYGMPTSFVRSDLLPSSLQTLTEKEVETASEGIFYYEGFPTLEDGTTFWHQLPHEPYEAYQLFMRYIEQCETVGIRQIDLLAVEQRVALDMVMTLSHEYMWSIRARAHDIFVVAADQKRRYLRTRKTEDKHFVQAGALLDKLLQRFQGDNADWIDELNAKEAIEALETLVKIQRLSLGLTGANASSLPKNGLPEGADTETLIRHITRGSGMSQQQEGSFIERLQALTENPEDGMRVQEAILRIGYAGRGEMHTDQMGLS